QPHPPGAELRDTDWSIAPALPTDLHRLSSCPAGSRCAHPGALGRWRLARGPVRDQSVAPGRASATATRQRGDSGARDGDQRNAFFGCLLRPLFLRSAANISSRSIEHDLDPPVVPTSDRVWAREIVVGRTII